MGGIITSGQTRYQIDRSFNKLFVEEQAKRTKYYPAIFTAKDAEPGPSYKEGRIAELGVAQVIQEGQRPSLVVPKEGNSVERFYFKRGLSLVFTEERMDDDIHGTWKGMPKQLNDAIEEALEYDAAGVLELGHTSALGEDGKALFADDHAILNPMAVKPNGGTAVTTIDNKLAASLSTTSLQAAVAYGQKLVKENGFLMPCRMVGIVIHPDDQWVADDLLHAKGRVWDYARMNAGDVAAGTGTAGFPAADARNLLNPQNGAIDGWKIYVNPYLTNNNRFYALFEGYELSLRWKYRPRLVKDEDRAGTGDMIWTSKSRYGVWCNKYKFMLASGTFS